MCPTEAGETPLSNQGRPGGGAPIAPDAPHDLQVQGTPSLPTGARAGGDWGTGPGPGPRHGMGKARTSHSGSKATRHSVPWPPVPPKEAAGKPGSGSRRLVGVTRLVSGRPGLDTACPTPLSGVRRGGRGLSWEESPRVPAPRQEGAWVRVQAWRTPREPRAGWRCHRGARKGEREGRREKAQRGQGSGRWPWQPGEVSGPGERDVLDREACDSTWESVPVCCSGPARSPLTPGDACAPGINEHSLGAQTKF